MMDNQPVDQDEVSRPLASTPNIPRMSQPPPPPPVSSSTPFDISSIHNSDVSLLTDESGEGIPLNDALIHSTLGSLMEEAAMSSSLTSFEEHETESSRSEAAGDGIKDGHETSLMKETENVVPSSQVKSMDVTAELPPDSDDDESWFASAKKRVGVKASVDHGDESFSSSAVKDVSQVQAFQDFGHPNVDAVPETKSSQAAKSSDEDDYEVIPAQRDMSNLISMSPAHTSFSEDAGNTTVLEKKSSGGGHEDLLGDAPSSRDLSSNLSSSPSVQSTGVTTTTSKDKEQEVLREDSLESASPPPSSSSSAPSEATGEKKETVPVSSYTATSFAPSSQLESQSSFPSPPVKDTSREERKDRLSSEREPDSSSAPLSVKRQDKKLLPESPKRTQSQATSSGKTDIMAEASSTTGCPFSAGMLWLLHCSLGFCFTSFGLGLVLLGLSF